MRSILSSLKSVHIIGIGGSGVSGLARLLLAQNVTVTGSDTVESEIIEKLREEGVAIAIGHKAENLPADTQAVIYSPAVPADNPEIVRAVERKISSYSHFEFIGLMSRNYETIAVSGTNGKSTTTAMVGLILEAAGFDPTVLVGAVVPKWGSNVKVGDSKILVVEADEYKKKFLQLTPKHIAITNIEADHLDVYGNLEEIKKAFSQFLESVPEEGRIILNSDDLITSEVVSRGLKKERPRDLYYGIAGDYVRLKQIVHGKEQIVAKIEFEGKEKEIKLRIPGAINVYNALAATALCLSLGVEFKLIKEVLENFSGIERRFQIMGKLGNAVIVSDYAHHPTSIKATIQAAKEFYFGKKILAVFQPHQHHRTKVMFNELVSALVEAKPEGLIVSEIFQVKGRTAHEDISSKELVEKIAGSKFCENLSDTEQRIRDVADKYDVVLIMGAGDIHRVARKLVSK